MSALPDHVEPTPDHLSDHNALHEIVGRIENTLMFLLGLAVMALAVAFVALAVAVWR